MQSTDSERTSYSAGETRLRAGQRLYGAALRAILTGTQDDSDDLKIREALRVLRSAMNWLEGTERFEVAHQFLDKAGSLAREVFSSGCELTYRDGSYYQECAAALAHSRVGMSAGYIVQESHCSICLEDLEDCPHVPGRFYDGKACCRVVTQADLLEVSLVERPMHPDARIESFPVDISDIKESLGPGFSVGMPVLCDRCLSPCTGVRYPFSESKFGD
jgi:hypothetical protein